MTLDELVQKLNKIADRGDDDPEANHSEADKLLLEYIGDEAVHEAFDRIFKWYA